MTHSLSVIIRSAGRRKKEILQAIESAINQKNIDVTVIVVLNGPNVDPAILRILQNMNNVIVEYNQDFDLPDATLKGRQLVEGEFFCYLDDDDLFIEDSLYDCCHLLSQKTNLDVVVCNGYIDNGIERHLMYSEPIILEESPLKELFDQNWLASCGGVYRSATVGESYFSVRLKYFEWTMTAFLLALDRRIVYLNDPIFIINNTEGSLSASPEYLESNPRFLKLLLSYPVPKNIKKIIKQRRSASFHNISETYLRQKKYGKAWMYHLKSLCSSQGLKYLSYTRHLFH